MKINKFAVLGLIVVAVMVSYATRVNGQCTFHEVGSTVNNTCGSQSSDYGTRCDYITYSPTYDQCVDAYHWTAYYCTSYPEFSYTMTISTYPGHCFNGVCGKDDGDADPFIATQTVYLPCLTYCGG